jgi:hypothetical protein
MDGNLFSDVAATVNEGYVGESVLLGELREELDSQ